MNLSNRLPLNYWQAVIDPTFFAQMKAIDWQAIFLRLINSGKSREFTLTQTINAIMQYGMFLSLIQKYPYMRMVPNQEIDAVLHAHIADAYQFEKDCKNLFNANLRHLTEVGIRGEVERQEWLFNFSHTHKLFKQNFGYGAMGSPIPACCEILLNFASLN